MATVVRLYSPSSLQLGVFVHCRPFPELITVRSTSSLQGHSETQQDTTAQPPAIPKVTNGIDHSHTSNNIHSSSSSSSNTAAVVSAAARHKSKLGECRRNAALADRTLRAQAAAPLLRALSWPNQDGQERSISPPRVRVRVGLAWGVFRVFIFSGGAAPEKAALTGSTGEIRQIF